MTWHKIIIGSSETMKELADASVDLCVTSPPYGVGINYLGPYNDSADRKVYLTMMENVYKELFRVMKDGCLIAINVSDASGINSNMQHSELIEKVGFNFERDIIWRKPPGQGSGFGTTIQNPYSTYFYTNMDYEHILIYRKGLKRRLVRTEQLDLNEIKQHGLSSSVWEDLPTAKNDNIRGLSIPEHPAKFNVELPYTIIKLLTVKNDVILDPFLGSGTTTLAARKLGRNSVGFEISKEYLPLIREKVGIGQQLLNAEEVSYEVIDRDVKPK